MSAKEVVAVTVIWRAAIYVCGVWADLDRGND